MKGTALIIMLLFYVSGFAQDTLDLFNCYEMAETNFPIYKQKELYKSSDELSTKNISTIYYPRLNLTGKASYQSDVTKIEFPDNGMSPMAFPEIPEQAKDQYGLALDMSQVIYDGGLNKTLKNINQANLDFNLQKVDVELYKLKGIVNSMYFGILILQETSEQLKTTIKTLEEQKKIIKSGIDNGILLDSDGDLLSAEILKLEQKQLELKKNKLKLLASLSDLIGTELSNESIIPLPDLTVLPSATARPEDILFDLTKSKMDASSQLLSKKRMPMVYGFGQLGYGRPALNMLSNSFDSYYIVGAKLSWNIWDWNKTSRDKQKIEISKQIINTQKETFDKNTNIALKNTQSDIDNLKEMIVKDKQIIALRENISKKSQSQLKNGVVNFSDYIIDINAETIARIESAIHKVQLVQANINYITIKGF